METGIAKFIKSLTDFFLHAFLLFIIAAHLGLNITSLLAVLGTASLALGLALQNTLANFAGGVLILVMKPYKVGDYIVCVGRGGYGFGDWACIYNIGNG